MLFILKADLCAFGFKVGKIYANMIFKKITKINMDNKSAEFEAYFESVEKVAKKVSCKNFYINERLHTVHTERL